MELLSQIFVACGVQGPPPLIIGVGLEVFVSFRDTPWLLGVAEGRGAFLLTLNTLTVKV